MFDVLPFSQHQMRFACLGIVNMKRGIFQGDSQSPLLFFVALIPVSMMLWQVKAGNDLAKRKGSLNHLLFMDDLKLFGKNEKQVDTLVNTVRIFSDDTGMGIGISKCAVLIMRRRKLCTCESIVLPDKLVIRGLKEDDGYKNLGILLADDMKHCDMKEALSKEYLRRINQS